MPPAKMMGDGRKAKDPKKTLLRLLSYMKPYTLNLIVVMICVVVTAFAQTRGSENIGTLVDDYILPMVASGSTDFAPLVRYLVKIAAIFACGMVAAFLILLGSGLMGGNANLSIAQGAYYLFAACPIAFGGWFSALKQAEVATAGISVLAKRPEAVGKAVISASFVELYAILALLISLMLILG